MVLSLVINHQEKFLGELRPSSVLDFQEHRPGRSTTDSKQALRMEIRTQEITGLRSYPMFLKGVKY